MKIEAAKRLMGDDDYRGESEISFTASRQLRAAEELLHADGFQIETGSNSFKCHDPADAYAKAAQIIKQIEHEGFKFTNRGAMSNKMDVWRKSDNEISISVRNSILNIDLW